MASAAIEPAACRALALADVAPPAEGAAMAMGTSLDAAAGASTAVTLASGLAPAVLRKSIPTGELAKCAHMSMTVGGVKATLKVTALGAVGSVPGVTVYRTDTALADGRKQSMITARAVQHGVLITVLAAGGPNEKEAGTRAVKLLDAAAALIK